ncbi:MAG: single-stranded-DNA-specific exonuclease RecJ [Patescibacteria group bacterium]
MFGSDVQVKIKSEDVKPSSIEEVVQALLRVRGLEKSSVVEDFFSPSHPLDLDPNSVDLNAEFLSLAKEKIEKAISENRPIVIHGDYDVDGLCATAILWEAIYRELGYKKCLPFIPNRFDHGYGFSEDSLREITNYKFQVPNKEKPLIVTVDCGVTAHRPLELAGEKGFDVLVTDHHQRDSQFEETFGFEYDLRDILWTDETCGAGIAWFLARSLLGEKSDQFLDLVSLAAIADIEPLLGTNRSLVKFGLDKLNESPRRLGLQSLAKIAGVDERRIGLYEIGWVLAPRLNAAGRLDEAIKSLRLLCTEDEKQANSLAQELDRINRERQETTEKMLATAKMSVDKEQLAIVTVDPAYHEGVIGLLAGKLVEKYHRPVLAISEGGQVSKGSARSVKGFDVIAALRELANYLVDVGGHPMAAGFTLETEKLPEFQAAFYSLVKEQVTPELLCAEKAADLDLPLSLVCWDLWEEVKKFEPFGRANPRPVFWSDQLGVVDVTVVGKDKKHLKLRLQDTGDTALGGKTFPAIGFGLGSDSEGLRLGSRIDALFNLSENVWNGNRTLQLQIKDFRLHEE